jgi:mRNA interferase MazF
MRNTIDCSFGDVVLVPFPFTDQSTAKKRPAVVVSVEQWSAAGLLKASVIKPVFLTVTKELVLKRLGALEVKDETALRTALHQVLG